jgi:DNA-binding NarL/FixJ family response regulator
VTGATTRVLVVEDNAVYRATLELLLPADGAIEVVGSAGDAVEAASLAVELAPDVVLLDLRLPGPTGADAVALLRRACAAPVLCLTAEPDATLAAEALAAGALAILDKAAATRDLADAIRSAAQP